MNKLGDIVLRGLRKAYRLVFQAHPAMLPCENDPDRASDIIYDQLVNDRPCMVARFGCVELQVVSNWKSVTQNEHSISRYIKGEEFQWWWNDHVINALRKNAGFFSSNMQYIDLFCKMMIRDMQDVDILGSWRQEETYFSHELEQSKKIRLAYLVPFLNKNPWSRVLEGKHVLVVHPFAEEISRQYHEHREQLFEDKRVLPKFASLRVVKAVQSLGGEARGFKDWFEALEWMEYQMDSTPYDVALIGCGAYGFPLAAHAKRTGHKAVHIGGGLQLLFGIKGRRWDAPNNMYNKLYNNSWIRPYQENIPAVSDQIEGGCYW